MLAGKACSRTRVDVLGGVRGGAHLDSKRSDVLLFWMILRNLVNQILGLEVNHTQS